ncbi:MAG TPA: sugar ABC transporter permease [Clostridiaceae bacterium]|nr:sugar ABC transporter permease [Clostridiaceae bacterium]
MTVPFLVIIFIFSYVPLFGWSFSFFDYKAGHRLLDTNFVGLKYFMVPFSNPILRADIVRVLRNTLAMSFLGIGTSMLPMFFAIFLAEIGCRPYRKAVQTLTTIPHFISWVLVYSVVWSLFSLNDGFINHLLLKLNLIETPIAFLGTDKHVWITQWAYGMWKNLGWNAILYISSLNSIDTALYEAAEIDGAGRFGKIFYITIPGLLPTFFVLLMLSIGNLLNNGMEQYFIFQTAMNKEYIEVLDLYVYNQGIRGNNISYATAVGMSKSVISLILLFTANWFSKLVRGESIF